MLNNSRQLNRIAILSVHTSPLHQPGIGDSGGMNVYIAETSKRIAERGIEVEIFTRATSAKDQERIEMSPGVTVRNIAAGPFEGLRKEDLPAQLCAVTAGVLREEATRYEGYFDLIHSHYWLSGQVGWIAQERWGVPLVHTMHTMARVKNLNLADGDTPEPNVREIGEDQVVQAADRLVANTEAEAQDLINLYSSDPSRVRIVHPGVDLNVFTPGSKSAARHELGIKSNAVVLLFVGRIQPLKAPDVLIKATAELIRHQPQLRDRLIVPVCGGPSGSGISRPDSLIHLTEQLGVSENILFVPPTNRARLVRWFQAADVTLIPSHNESFGLVALESQACGTPVIAAKVGGLTTAVADKSSGLLVDGHNPHDWAHALEKYIADDNLQANLSRGALDHAAKFSWEATTEKLIEVYQEAIDSSIQRKQLA